MECISKELELDNFKELKIREELHSALWREEFDEPVINDIYDILTYKQNLINYSSFLSQTNHTELRKNQKLLAASHQSLYSWIYGNRFKSFGDLISSSNGKGIVMSTGDFHFKYARSTIDTLRNVLNCTLPIELFYIGEDDLNQENRNILNQYSDIYLTDISTLFNNEILNLSGWAVKPFSILGSRFEEIIFMDADVVFVRDPAELFDEPGYIETGTLFYKDRTLFSNDKSLEWLKKWMTDPLPETKELRYWEGKTYHEMESGVVVIHKIKTILGLLNTCKLNEYAYREKIVYSYVHGDKETFWIGFDMARQHYYINEEMCSLFGDFLEISETKRYLCGHIAHTNNGSLMFWNGHLIKDKHSNELRNTIIDFKGYFTEIGQMKWDWDYGNCLVLEDDYEVIPINEEEQKVMNDIVDREIKYHFIIPKEKLLIYNEFLRNKTNISNN
ncbi:hypothetical protein BCR36DRAFT_401320 [Piromyces finnis]|uniref:Nucleotide-diphospho-sugar transferase n=1 Tax=Piromyces finnis TaxID=1754191 RepID=A0A1Y1VNT3_9FUNG|nr:hypothetical protein BCR36DRAFT_401320 [Piromyces finnis]|eukprot:ORX61068.1 hypothetical protein BCR36DRAFT_401320 [Piromyces finnis]